ncbi:DNA double-strand break repair nuclease NurA [Salisaeta longa]|uniref:DNA double-strand break repair nuclease NurA n=1 Tax=Salisaeta longa TaxID=503170 RepID=UPI0003B75C21|nr:DNA double-strand break repair nuclease NurA [Salisaeta longa]
MLDLRKLHEQLADFRTHERTMRDRRTEQLARARAALEACAGADWAALRDRVQACDPSPLVAELRDDPTARYAAPERPTPLTIVAADGSQIYPDRHVEPTFFLLNISKIAFQYGTTEPPVLDAVPDLHFRERLDAHFDATLGSVTTEVVSALRDEAELRMLLDTARDAICDGRPLVALADGTLIRWMLRGMRNRAVEEELIARYASMLRSFRDEALPLASYISRPANTEVVNFLRVVLAEIGALTPLVDTGAVPEGAPLEGLLDRTLMQAVLDVGERSAVFQSTSHIQASYEAESAICYVYVKIPVGAHRSEIARIECPRWVADAPALLDTIHALVLDECQKGDGYPIALSEAHERAVVRAPEREAFFRLLDRTFRRDGLPAQGSRKRFSKQRPRV